MHPGRVPAQNHLIVARFVSFTTSLGLRLIAVFAVLWGDDATACTRTDDSFTAERERMVEAQLADREIKDSRVLAAMRALPRHLFVPAPEAQDAYDDRPLPIGHGQTISQPYIVALMTELVRPTPRDRALEVGTGSGYQAAVLASLVSHVYTIEIVPSLARDAEAVLKKLDCDNVTVRAGDGYGGWPEHAPFDIIVVTAAPESVPEPLLQQLKPGGRLVVPVGSQFGIQELQLIEKDSSGELSTTRVATVRFVPLLREPRKN
jgi:protein-L-isoaspartate(D-aspartate) O-methyltransferase